MTDTTNTETTVKPNRKPITRAAAATLTPHREQHSVHFKIEGQLTLGFLRALCASTKACGGDDAVVFDFDGGEVTIERA